MITVSKTTIGVVLSGVVGLCFLSYLIFLGPERSNDAVIKSNRLKKRLAENDGETGKLLTLKLKLPVSIKHLADLEILVKELNMGEYYLSHGDSVLGVKHLANAMVSCQNPDVLYKVLRNKLPKHVFEMLTEKLLPEQVELWSSSNILQDLAFDTE
ncbi:TOMM20-like protein 1 [Metopolophium dirhodum]|uniref:TOMM20-like protein 1 n=1 Tax=Metopolophium dirhodum TaxID=44670 RepID=UPI00298F6F76|nr:TOMM20-like protein 1 [Metopolophium dirhodum]